LSTTNTFPDAIGEVAFANEADVETRLVLPLLHALGYADEDIRPKYPVIFREGKKGRPNEADFAVFAAKPHDRDHSLLVVEAKHPTEKLGSGQAQGESYAANLRAPFLILTNGVDFELWQMQIAAESQLVFSTHVSSLPAKWDELTSLIAKPAAQKYMEDIRRRDLTEFSRDLSAYIAAELARTANYKSAIARRLYPLAGDSSQWLMSDEFINSLDNGAVVAAPSGYGKTTLAISLLRQSLSSSGSPGQERLVVEANLPEIAIAQQSVVEFVQNRLSSHCPQISVGALKHLFRSSGALLLFDGYDRLKPNDRDALLLQVKNLRRDFPAVQTIILSRTSTRPSIDLPIYELKEYSSEERKAYIDAEIAPKGIHPSVPITSVPDPLQTLFAIPLLFHLAMNYWMIRRSYSTDLNALFRSWIDSLFESANFTPTKKIAAEAALRVFARESSKGIMPASAVPTIFKAQGLPSDVLDDLIQCDALRVEGRSIEIVHETLGDYLRACDVAESGRQALAASLRDISLPIDSMFPVLLSSILESRDHLSILLGRLAVTDLQTYFEALRYRANNSAQVTSSQGTFANTYLEDMLDGLEQPLGAFFEQLHRLITGSLVGMPVAQLAILGGGTPDWISYQFLPLENNGRVTIGPFIDQYRLRGSNLRLLGLRPDSGRLLGLSVLREELTKLPEARHLYGGLEWRSERLVGWVRLLINEFGFPISLDDNLADIETVLQKHASKFLVRGHFRESRFPVDVLLEDIATLRNRGDARLLVWWKRFGKADEDILDNEENTRGLFNEYYRRVQLVYKEVVEHSFAAVRHLFGFYTSMPVRWDIAVPPRRDAFRQPWTQYRWLPVKTWDEAGADLEFVSEQPKRFNWSSFSEIQEEVRKLGRLTKHTHIWGGSGIAPRFDGNSMNGGFDGETAVMREVCDYIKDDIKRLFEHCPGADIPYFEIDRDTPWQFATPGPSDMRADSVDDSG
jgi:hypothetical protein